MQFNSINHYQPTFQAVTPIIATSGGKAAIEHALVNYKDQYRLLDLTDYLEQKSGMGLTKRRLFLLTGQEYIDDMFMRNGWEDMCAPLRYVNRATLHITERSSSLITRLVKRVLNMKDLEIVSNFNNKIKRLGPNLKNVNPNCAF